MCVFWGKKAFRQVARFPKRDFARIGPYTALGLVLLLGLARPLAAQEEASAGQPVSLVRDWSSKHILFTNGASPEVAVATQRDPRSWQNWLYRNAGLLRTMQTGTAVPSGLDQSQLDQFQLNQSQLNQPEAETALFASGAGRIAPPFRRLPPVLPARNRHSKIDWSMSLGGGPMAVAETPAKYSFDITKPPDCTNDFVVYVISATPGVGTQANIVAFNNLYSGTAPSLCNRTTPTFLWSYAVGTGSVDLSPVLSLDGKKVAFIESGSSALFHVLTWVAGQGTNATTGAVAVGSGSSVTTLDYTNITTTGCPANTGGNPNGSPYVDYGNDYVYLVASNGILYRVKGVFKGTPTLDICITVSAGAALTSPVYDSVSNKVFVSDGATVYAYTPGATSFTLASSVKVSATTSGVILSPIVDSTNKFVYVFSSNNNAGTNAIVSQMPTSLASHTDVAIGPKTNGGTTAYIVDGDFDNKYFATGPKTGSLYVCGTQTGLNTRPALYTVSFGTTGVMNTTPAMSNDVKLNSATNPKGVCSPLTEFYDGTNDRLFGGVGALGSTSGANWVTMWNINSQITVNTTAPTATATNELGGTSGITIDNASSSAQAASIYFGTEAAGSAAPCGAGLYCAVKLTQSGLQ